MDRAHRTLSDAHSLGTDSPIKHNPQIVFGKNTARVDNAVIKEINEAAHNHGKRESK